MDKLDPTGESNRLNQEKPEYRNLYQGKVLNDTQSFAFIFQTDPPDDSIKETLKHGLSEYFSSGVLAKVSSIEAHLEFLRDTEIKSSNTFPISFRKRSDPWYILGAYVFAKSHPMAIDLTNQDQVKKLDSVLREDKTLTTGVFAGALLLSTRHDILQKGFKGSIAVGVVEKDTNNPLGVVFCPEGMLDFKFVDYDQGKRRKRIIGRPLAVGKTVQVGVEI